MRTSGGEYSIAPLGRVERCAGGWLCSQWGKKMDRVPFQVQRRSADRVATAEQLAPFPHYPCEWSVRSWGKADCRQVHNTGGIFSHHEDALADAEDRTVLRADPVS